MKKIILFSVAVFAIVAIDAGAQILHRPLFHRHPAHSHSAPPVQILNIVGQGLQNTIGGSNSAGGSNSTRIDAPRQVTDDLKKIRENLDSAETSLKDLFKKNKIEGSAVSPNLAKFAEAIKNMTPAEKEKARDALRKDHGK